jgi:hypothetical protein
MRAKSSLLYENLPKIKIKDVNPIEFKKALS